MNVKPQREGFVTDEREPVTIEHEPPQQEAPRAGAAQRATPPPEIEPSPAELPPLDENPWPLVVLLNKPIRDNAGQMVKEITLREPRAGDINRYGNPVRINGDGDPIIDERKMTYMIASLSGILAPFIEDMTTRDWNTCAYKLRRFFFRSSGLVGSEEDIILDCYQLARWYHVSPEVFLAMTLSEVALHWKRTVQIAAREAAAKDDGDD